MNWSIVPSQSSPNLNVLSLRGVERGFIYRPKNTKTDKSAWRLFVGIGEAAQFVGHDFNKKSAKKKVESFLK